MIAEVRSLLPDVVAGLALVPTRITPAGILALGAAVAVVAGVVAVRAAPKPRPRARYGPGPPGIPVLGNALELPTENDFLVYTSWAKKWGA